MTEPRFVGYIRVSTKGQESSGLGLEAQQATIRRYVERTGGTLLEEFQETESGKRSDRPELAKALERCRETGAVLLIAKLDRLSRKLHFVTGLQESKVPFAMCDMPDAEPFMIHIYAAWAEEEARRISKRTKDALAARRARGLPMGAAAHKRGWTEAKDTAWRAIIGKRNAAMKYKAIEFARTVAPRARELREQQKSLSEIAAVLNQEGYRTTQGKKWNKMQVKRVLNLMWVDTSENMVAVRVKETNEDIMEMKFSGMSHGQIIDLLNTKGIPNRFGRQWVKPTVSRTLISMGMEGPRGFVIEPTELERIQQNYKQTKGEPS